MGLETQLDQSTDELPLAVFKRLPAQVVADGLTDRVYDLTEQRVVPRTQEGGKPVVVGELLYAGFSDEFPTATVHVVPPEYVVPQEEYTLPEGLEVMFENNPVATVKAYVRLTFSAMEGLVKNLRKPLRGPLLEQKAARLKDRAAEDLSWLRQVYSHTITSEGLGLDDVESWAYKVAPRVIEDANERYKSFQEGNDENCARFLMGTQMQYVGTGEGHTRIVAQSIVDHEWYVERSVGEIADAYKMMEDPSGRLAQSASEKIRELQSGTMRVLRYFKHSVKDKKRLTGAEKSIMALFRLMEDMRCDEKGSFDYLHEFAYQKI